MTALCYLKPRAAAQLFGQVLGDNLKVTRKPIVDAGRNAPHRPNELENRVGSRILPDWMDVVDDPTQTQLRGHTLLGHYLYDIEGVAPQPLTLVEKGHAEDVSADAHAGAERIRKLQRTCANDGSFWRRRSRIRQPFYSRLPDHSAAGFEEEADRFVPAA